jgi:hypothetical protein
VKLKNFYTYFVICFILILAVVAFYVSCQSKSPTESAAALHNQVSVQSTNNTTTSSSTTTTTQPGQSPSSTTTLITSRNLTTTSTSTSTTTSIPITTTTTKKPTTTSIGTPLLKWCSVTINGTQYANGSRYDTTDHSKKLTIGVFIKNRGTALAQKVAANLYIEESTWEEGFKVYDGHEHLGTIPDDKKCYGTQTAFYMEVSPVVSGDSCWIHIIVKVPGCDSCSIDYYIYIDADH